MSQGRRLADAKETVQTSDADAGTAEGAGAARRTVRRDFEVTPRDKDLGDGGVGVGDGGLKSYGHGSIPINANFRGMHIHLPAILMFTRGYKVLSHPHIETRFKLIGFVRFLIRCLDG